MTLFQGLFDSSLTDSIEPGEFILCLAVALVIGLLTAVMYLYKNRCSKSFASTLAVLPAVVAVIIMLVNGNIGAGVAVAGAFSLVRFRSAPGTAKEIGAIFTATGAGLLCGMGYLAYAVLFAVVMGLVGILYTALNFGGRSMNRVRRLRITVPEDLNYVGAFEDVFAQYTKSHEMTGVKTTNMGTMYRLTYEIEMKNADEEKAMIDALRCRNGNLEIALSQLSAGEAEM